MYGHSRQPWNHDIAFRMRFERGVRRTFPALQIEVTGRTFKHQLIYRLTVPVPGYEPRRLTIRVPNSYRPWPKVFADGSAESPHRYSDESLCMWHPKDPPDQTWQPEEGLLTLIRYAQEHLYREAYWRERGLWIGEQAPHETPKLPS